MTSAFYFPYCWKIMVEEPDLTANIRARKLAYLKNVRMDWKISIP